MPRQTKVQYSVQYVSDRVTRYQSHDDGNVSQIQRGQNNAAPWAIEGVVATTPEVRRVCRAFFLHNGVQANGVLWLGGLGNLCNPYMVRQFRSTQGEMTAALATKCKKCKSRSSGKTNRPQTLLRSRWSSYSHGSEGDQTWRTWQTPGWLKLKEW